MKPRALGWIAAVTGGSLQGADGWVDAVAIDTRALPSQGQPLFVALKGENFDGHAHVQAAANGGCVAALVAHPVDANITQIIVPNTERALADLAAAAPVSYTHLGVYKRQECCSGWGRKDSCW